MLQTQATLSIDELEAYLASQTQEQAGAIRSVRNLVLEINPHLVEEVDEGKWFGGLLTYSTTDKIVVFALGPLTGGFCTFHMMPYYGSPELQQKHGAALKKLLSGKSCIKFKEFSQIPGEPLREIVEASPRYEELARAMHAKKAKK